MADLTFGIDTPERFFEKLEAEQADVYRAPANPRHSINAALNAHHMIEWVWVKQLEPMDARQRKAVTGKIIRRKKDLETWAFAECSDLELMQAISNGSKHLAPNTAIAATGTTVADWSGNGDWRREDFPDVSKLVLIKDDGTRIVFEDALRRVVEWYRSVLDHIRKVTPPVP
jgi:hypothetical protein